MAQNQSAREAALLKQRYCRKINDNYVYPWTDELGGRPDFLECNREGVPLNANAPAVGDLEGQVEHWKTLYEQTQARLIEAHDEIHKLNDQLRSGPHAEVVAAQPIPETIDLQPDEPEIEEPTFEDRVRNAVSKKDRESLQKMAREELGHAFSGRLTVPKLGEKIIEEWRATSTKAA